MKGKDEGNVEGNFCDETILKKSLMFIKISLVIINACLQ